MEFNFYVGNLHSDCFLYSGLAYECFYHIGRLGMEGAETKGKCVPVSIVLVND
jgi:hypothetical protein